MVPRELGELSLPQIDRFLTHLETRQHPGQARPT